MTTTRMLAAHDWHQKHGATFHTVSGCEQVIRYAPDPLDEHRTLQRAAGILDLSFRGRVCLLGSDRQRFLNGQVTNEVLSLPVGRGCYAALVNAKGKIEADLNITTLPDEILLDFEPGITERVTKRFDHYIVADDVETVDVAELYGLISLIGPRASELVSALSMFSEPLPQAEHQAVHQADPTHGELYLIRRSRAGLPGFDLLVPTEALSTLLDQCLQSGAAFDAALCGTQALEWHRIEHGIPRFGIDMDESNLAPEPGLADRAIHYAKGCYIGQEILARIRTYGQVTKTLRGFLLPQNLPALPQHGEKLLYQGKEAGYLTSSLFSPTFQHNIALGYARKECHQPGTELQLASAPDAGPVRVVQLPFHQNFA